jgi:NhaP-type Na+/H+ or K+/H+ antiporter
MPTPLPPLPALALLLGGGAVAQWLAWRLRIPAILVLLLAGFMVGPVTGLLDPDAVFGGVFRPLVSLAVGLILFEGGLTLRFDELRGAGRLVRNLVSVGALVTWVLSTLAGVYIAGVAFDVALLVGAILVLTGPTVVIPLVRYVRPRPPLGQILRWEGILIDPIGALLALLVLEALTGPDDATPWQVVLSILRTLVFGGGLGVLAGLGLARAIKRFLVPDMLHVPVTLGCVTATFVAANMAQPEAGLLATTVMGIVLANRRTIDIAHIVEWKEQLSTILLSVLFVAIAARVPLDQLTHLGWRAVFYTAALVLIVRPVAVWVSTRRSSLPWPDRAFLMAMAPRGIVAAAVSSEFSLHFEHSGNPGAPAIVALVFPVIVLSVVCYGLSARPLARLFGVAKADPQGVLVVGADVVGREIGRALREQGLDVLLVDTNEAHAAAARALGLRTWHGSVLSTRFADEAELAGIGHVLAITPSDEVNRLAMQQFLPMFGRGALFRVSPADKPRPGRDAAPGRVFASAGTTIESLRDALQSGWGIKATWLTNEFGPGHYQTHYGKRALPLFVLSPDRKLQIVTEDGAAALRVGSIVLSLVPPRETGRAAAVRAGDEPAG